MRGKERLQRLISTHEAGHVVSAIEMGVPVKSATIVPDPSRGLGGLVSFGKAYTRAKGMPARAIVVSLAGPAAQRVAFPRSDVQLHGSGDFECARAEARALSSSPQAAAAMYRWAQSEAADLVRRRWAAVELVADELLEKRTLSGAQIGELLQPMQAAEDAAVAELRAAAQSSPALMEELRRQAEAHWSRKRPVGRGEISASLWRVMVDVFANADDRPLADLRTLVGLDMARRGFDESIALERFDALIAARAPAVSWKPLAAACRSSPGAAGSADTPGCASGQPHHQRRNT